MNTKYRLSATLTVIILTLSAYAQQHIDEAINEFLLDKKSSEYILSNNKEQEFVPADGKNALFNEIGFRLKRSDADILERLRKAFLSDSDKAYGMMMKSSGSGSNETIKITYGAELNKSQIFGTYDNRNYIVLNIKDSSDSTWRWSYALVWYDDKSGTGGSKYYGSSKYAYISGSVHIIHSRDPKVNISKKENVSLRTTILPDGTVVTYNSDKDTKTVVYKNGNVVGDSSADYSDVNSSSRFLVLFGNLRSVFLDAYKEHSGLAMKTTIANRMLDLCKKKGGLLSKGERSLCRNILNEMARGQNDRYIIGLLNMAADTLK